LNIKLDLQGGIRSTNTQNGWARISYYNSGASVQVGVTNYLRIISQIIMIITTR